MKFFLSNALVSITTVVLPFSFMASEIPEDPPKEKESRHIKLVKIDDEGNKTELDTIIEGDGVFVWNGDTVGNEMDFDVDFDFDVDGENAHAFVFKFKDLDSLEHLESKIIKDVDEALSDIRVWKDKDGTSFMLPEPPHPPHPPHLPQMMHIEKRQSGNSIDLSDPGIISYKKRDKSRGREKITIIREKPKEGREKQEEIIVTGTGKDPHFLHNAPPKMHKFEVTEDDEETKIIEEDGKVIKIRKQSNGNENEVEVKVEVIKEEETPEDDNN